MSNVFQYFTAPQRMKILGADGLSWEDFDFDPRSLVPWGEPLEDHWRRFSIEVAQGSLHGASKDREKQVAISLFRLGGISRRKMLEVLGFTDIDQIEAEIAREQGGALEPQATGKGQVPRLTRGQRTGNPY